MKPSWSRLNSRITPMMGVPFGPGGRAARALTAVLIGKSSVLFMLLFFDYVQRKGTLSVSQRAQKNSAFLCEILCALCVKMPLAQNSLQQIFINPRLASGNQNRSDRFLIKLERSGAANDPVNESQFSQPPQRGDQQSLPDTTAAFAFADTGRAEEVSAGAFVTGKADHLGIASRDINRHRLFWKGNRNFFGPRAREILLDEISHAGDLKRLCAPNIDALSAKFVEQRLKLRQY